MPLEATWPPSTVFRSTVMLARPVLSPPAVRLPLPLAALAATVRLYPPPAKVDEVVTVVPVRVAFAARVKVAL